MCYKNILYKLIVCIITIAIMLCIIPLLENVSMAGIRGETPPPSPSPPRPSPTISDSPPGEPTGGTEVNCAEDWVITQVYTSVEGHVYEESANESEMVSIPLKPVQGVLSSLNGNTVATDEVGFYHIDSSGGTYPLEFKYGSLDALNYLEEDVPVSRILKYNGYDYYTSYLTNDTFEKKKYYVTEHEILASGKGAAQVYMAIDISISMMDKVTINGIEQRKIDAMLDASREVIHDLLSSGENVYIGIIVFWKESVRLVGLTKDEAFLNQAIDYIQALTLSTTFYGTNARGAFEKAYESFFVDPEDPSNSNRNIILISDGIATTDGTTEIYTDDPDSIYKGFNIIGPNTRQMIIDCVNDGINTLALLLDDPTLEDDEIRYRDSIYEGAVNYYRVAYDFEDFIDKIKVDITQFVVDQITQDDRYRSSKLSIRGHEDEERREKVDGLFNYNFYYNLYYPDDIFEEVNDYLSPRSSIFEEINIKDRNQITPRVQEFSNLTYMIVDGGTFIFGDLQANYDEVIPEFDCPTCGTKHSKTIHYVWEPLTYTQDMYIQRREVGALYTKVTATAAKLVLNDYRTFDFQQREMDDDKPIVEVVDLDIAQGATVEIEYTIEVKNSSSFQFDRIEVVDYFPKDFYFDGSTKLLTSNERNSDYGWEKKSIDKLYNDGNGYISEDTYNKYRDDYNVVAFHIDNNGMGEDGFYLPAGGTYTAKLVITRVISSPDSISGAIRNDAEILGYRNDVCRRTALDKSVTNNYITGEENNIGNEDLPEDDSFRPAVATASIDDESSIIGIYPGDTKIYDFEELGISSIVDEKASNGIDYAKSSNTVLIVPPTGQNANNKFDNLIAFIDIMNTLFKRFIIRKILM